MHFAIAWTLVSNSTQFLKRSNHFPKNQINDQFSHPSTEVTAVAVSVLHCCFAVLLMLNNDDSDMHINAAFD